MADNRDENIHFIDNEKYVDEIKAEDYNFYLLNNIISQNFILKNCMNINEEGIAHSLQKCYVNLPSSVINNEILTDTNYEKEQFPRISLSDTVLEDVLKVSTKSFLEKVCGSCDKNENPMEPYPGRCTTEKPISGSSHVTSNPAVSVNSVSETEILLTAETEDNSDSGSTNIFSSSSTIQTKHLLQKEQNMNVDISASDILLKVPQKRKGKTCNKNNANSFHKKLKLVAVSAANSSPNIAENDNLHKQRETAPDLEIILINPKENFPNNSVTKNSPAKQSNVCAEKAFSVATPKTGASSPNTLNEKCTVGDFEWSLGNMQLLGFALTEDKEVERVTDENKSDTISISNITPCSFGCSDLTSSDHLYHLHLNSLKLEHSHPYSTESTEKGAIQKTIKISQVKNNIKIHKKGDLEQKILDTSQKVILGEKVVVKKSKYNTPGKIIDGTNGSIQIELNNAKGNSDIRNRLKLHEKTKSHLCKKSVSQDFGNKPITINSLRNPSESSFDSAAETIRHSNAAISITKPAIHSQNNFLTSQNSSMQNVPYMYDLTSSSTTNNVYNPNRMYGFGSATNENYMQLDPFTPPNGSVWFGKPMQPASNVFNAHTVSPHVMNSPWYQQWFHAMSMRRSMASHNSSSGYNYFEPVKTNNYERTLWGTPGVGVGLTQHRMYPQAGNSMGSLPRMFQSPFSHSCFQAGIPCTVRQTTSHTPYINQPTEAVSDLHCAVSTPNNKLNTFEKFTES